MKRVRRMIYGAALAAVLAASSLEAAERSAEFPSDVEFDIFYQVGNYEVDQISRVKILETAQIEGTLFLVVSGSASLGKDKKGFIPFASIRAVLPSGYVVPRRTIAYEQSAASAQQ